MDNEILSKTKKKEQSHALQKLGAALVDLSKERLATMALPEALREAIREAQRITAHEGRRRQMQYIGKLMRDVDPAPIQERFDAWNGQSKAEVARKLAARIADSKSAVVITAAAVRRGVPRA